MGLLFLLAWIIENLLALAEHKHTSTLNLWGGRDLNYVPLQTGAWRNKYHDLGLFTLN